MLDGRAKVQKTAQRADSSPIYSSPPKRCVPLGRTVFLFYVKRRIRDCLIGELP